VDAVAVALVIGVLGVVLVWLMSSTSRGSEGRYAADAKTAKEKAAAEQRAAQARREGAQRAAEEAARLNEARKAFRAWEYICKAHALTCTRCGELAYPIPMTADRYACPACRHQFVGAPHTVQLPPPNPDA
jgi:hypothetical protein